MPLTWPLDVPPGDWARTLQTSWVEPGYLEPDASWCEPGGEPTTRTPTAARSAERSTPRSLASPASWLTDTADRSGCSRHAKTSSDRGRKRPPIAAGVRRRRERHDPCRSDPRHRRRDSGRPGPHLDVVEVDVDGPPTSAALRGAGWVEAPCCSRRSTSDPDGHVAGRRATAAAARSVTAGRGRVALRTSARPGRARSYCVGAAHMALGWVRAKGCRRCPWRAGRSDDPLVRRPARGRHASDRS